MEFTTQDRAAAVTVFLLAPLTGLLFGIVWGLLLAAAGLLGALLHGAGEVARMQARARRRPVKDGTTAQAWYAYGRTPDPTPQPPYVGFFDEPDDAGNPG